MPTKKTPNVGDKVKVTNCSEVKVYDKAEIGAPVICQITANKIVEIVSKPKGFYGIKVPGFDLVGFIPRQYAEVI